VLHLVFYQDMTIEEASHILNISLGTARTHFARGKQQLRQLLAVTDDRKEKRA
jgi:RNA polymerase sigma-70 factor (ECF subfamily)